MVKKTNEDLSKKNKAQVKKKPQEKNSNEQEKLKRKNAKEIDSIEEKSESSIEKDENLSDNSDEVLDIYEKPEINSKRTKTINNLIEGKDLTTGVLYVSHLPWGTNEVLIKKYFEQFGPISRYILPRSKTTGRIKGYAFIEFSNMEIASLAAKTMNNFILFDRILKCNVLADRTRYNLIFQRWKRQFKFSNKYQKFVAERNKKKSTKELKTLVENYITKENKKREKLRELGINYDFPGFKSVLEMNKPNKK